MKFPLTILLFFMSLAISAQVQYNMPTNVDPEVQQLLDEGEECLKTPDKDCKHRFLEAIAYGKKHNVPYMDYLYFQLGHYFDVRSQYDSAQYYTKIAYALTDKNNPNAAYPTILNSLGANHFRLGEYDQAASYMLLTVEVLETQDKPLNLVYAYNNLATLMGINENYDEAIKTLEGMPNKTPQLRDAYQQVLYLRGLQHYRDERFTAAKELFTKSVANSVDSYYKALALYWLGDISYQEKNYDRSIDYLNQFDVLAKTQKDLPDESSIFTAKYLQGYNYLKKKN